MLMAGAYSWRHTCLMLMRDLSAIAKFFLLFRHAVPLNNRSFPQTVSVSTVVIVPSKTVKLTDSYHNLQRIKTCEYCRTQHRITSVNAYNWYNWRFWLSDTQRHEFSGKKSSKILVPFILFTRILLLGRTADIVVCRDAYASSMIDCADDKRYWLENVTVSRCAWITAHTQTDSIDLTRSRGRYNSPQRQWSRAVDGMG